MTDIYITPMPTETAEAIWNGGADAYGMAPERHISDGDGVPCRHCLKDVAAGEPYLILAYRPFPATQPYAETGPVFLHAEPCAAYADRETLPPRYLSGEKRIVRAYDRHDRIVYGTGQVVDGPDIVKTAAALLDEPRTAYIHVRSSANNCFAFRIDRS